MCKALFEKFRELYERVTDFKVVSGSLDKNGNLTVTVKHKDADSEMWLHVKEKGGKIIWW